MLKRLLRLLIADNPADPNICSGCKKKFADSDMAYGYKRRYRFCKPCFRKDQLWVAVLAFGACILIVGAAAVTAMFQ